MTPVGPGRVGRPAAVAFAVLLLATAAAFGLANQLKSADAEIDVIRRDKFFSPNGDGRREREVIFFRVDQTDSAAIDIVDADGVRVRRVNDDAPLRRNRKRKVVWDGLDDDGAVAPDGEYRMRLILGQGRSLLAPKPFVLDTEPPEASVAVDEDSPIVQPGEEVAFTLDSEPGADVAPRFRVLRTDVSPPREVQQINGEVGVSDYVWDGKTGIGTPAQPGTYLIQAVAFDPAHNRTRVPSLPLSRGAVPGRPGVTVRRLAVQPPVRAVRAGAPVSVRVDARGGAFEWALRRIGQPEVVIRGKRPAGKTNILLSAPTGSSGLYMLTVEAGGASARVPIAVRGGARSGLLVVLPMLTWLGRDPVDGPSRDGVPDTFATAAEVGYPRPFAFPSGVPPYFGAGVAPLLEFLDSSEVPYDLVTDLDLARAEDALQGQDGVLMPGSAQWTSRALAGRLRDYVRVGGRLAVFGPQALTGSVEVGDEVLTDASPLTDGDALGGRLAAPRAVGPSSPLSVVAEDPQLGLLEGFSGTLSGFGRVEELTSPGPGELQAGIGVEGTDLAPVLSAVALGDGLVIRVGLPEWGERLAAGWAAPGQITANIVDILRGVEPRVRTARG